MLSGNPACPASSMFASNEYCVMVRFSGDKRVSYWEESFSLICEPENRRRDQARAQAIFYELLLALGVFTLPY